MHQALDELRDVLVEHRGDYHVQIQQSTLIKHCTDLVLASMAKIPMVKGGVHDWGKLMQSVVNVSVSQRVDCTGFVDTLIGWSIKNYYHLMNFLKKTLGKEDYKKDQKKMPASSFSKHQSVEIWNNNIDQLLEKKALRKEDTDFDRSINKIVQTRVIQPNNLESKQGIIQMFVEVYIKYDKVPKGDNGRSHKWQICSNLIKKLRQRPSDQRLEEFIRDLEVEMALNEKKEKRKKIEEFDTMVSFRNINPKDQSKTQDKIEKVKSKSKVRNRQERKNSQPGSNKSQSKSKKSLKSAKSGNNLSSNSLKKGCPAKKTSQHDLQYLKLQNLLKDISTKVVKGNHEYDYSSILQGSKSNIQCRKNRNTTVQQAPKPIDKKVKKNEAFVFYRPGR